MIYIHRDWSKIPAEITAALKEAAEKLDAISDPQARKKYIEDHSSTWTAVRGHLSAMSNDKCWYSESKEAVSRYQVDHFRPHGRSKQAAKTYAGGYSWLAFDIENYRIAGMLCNTVNQEYSEESVGKGDWFPLVDPSVRATLASRDTKTETPILLDPTDPDDPGRLWFEDDGTVVADPNLDEDVRLRVEMAIRCLGLRQSRLNGRRRSALRGCRRAVERYKRINRIPKGARTPAESAMLEEARSELLALSAPSAEFAAAVRCLLVTSGLRALIVQDELKPLAINAEDV